MDKESLRTTRTLTSKAMANFQETVAKFQRQLQEAWDPVASIITAKLDSADTIKLKKLKTEVFENFGKYDTIANEFTSFLEGVRSAESQDLLTLVLNNASRNRKLTNEFIEKLKTLKYENSSVISEQSRHSSASRTSSRGKLEAARVKAAFAEQAAELERQRAVIEEQERINAAASTRKKTNIEIDMKLLEKRQEVAFAEAELDRSVGSNDKLDSIPSADPIVRTREYVQQAANSNHHITLDPVSAEPSATIEHLAQTTSDFTRFLLRKDILMSRLSTFNEQPESFQSWKSTFSAVKEEIGASSSEEIDLLIKWLGPNSKKSAISLKTAYIHDPDVGLARIWSRLNERFGAPENIYSATVKKLEAFPKLTYKDCWKLYDLSDILSEIEGLKNDPRYSTTLSYFDSAAGIIPIVNKLPHNLQEKWTSRATLYKKRHETSFPPFEVFSEFVLEQSRIRNDPSFCYNTTSPAPSYINQHQQFPREKRVVYAKKTEVVNDNTRNLEKYCLLHRSNHSLNKCRVFKSKSLEERKTFLSDQKICFKCCESNKHRANNCTVSVRCDCGSTYHPGAMHIDQPQGESVRHRDGSQQVQHRGGQITSRREQQNGGETDFIVNNSCTQICRNAFAKSCTKLVLVSVGRSDNPCKTVNCYAMIDDQSNSSLAKPELFDMLNITSQEFEYTINSCAGTRVAQGRRASGCFVMSVDGSVTYQLPTLIECQDIPNDRNEICSPHDVGFHPHLSNLAGFIPEIDNEAQILLLIGRDLVEAHHIQNQIIGPPGAPFAQKLGLGWVVIGEMCLGKVHSVDQVNVNKTHVLCDGRVSLFPPCENRFVVAEKVKLDSNSFDPMFVQTANDDKPGPSMDDLEFLGLMDKGFCKTPDGKWSAPLPFRSSRSRLPNNRPDAVHRARSLHSSLMKNPVKRNLMVEFMAKIFNKGHAEIAPPLTDNEECWYLPMFGVFHPKKPNQIRAVFDSSAQCQGISLNSVLLSGPDLTNNLVGVLMRFRTGLVPAIGDIEQMFYCFLVDVKHRNFLRFLLYRENDPSQEMIEYRMTVHVFGNSSSPAVASYGLHKTVEDSDSDVQDFVRKNFYVDDGLTSKSSPGEVVDLIKRTQKDLGVCGLRLHKIASSSLQVMQSFAVEDLAKDMKCLDFESDMLPLQRSLGVCWNLELDCFTFKVETSGHPFTRRGILATVNSLFDPLGFLSPFTIIGKLILRDIVSEKCDWDQPVSQCVESKWIEWKHCLDMLCCLKIPRIYFSVSLSEVTHLSLHVFSDASEQAISAVDYLVGRIPCNTNIHVGFVMGKSKIAPSKGPTIPRLELCGAVLPTEISQSITDKLGLKFDQVKYYTDSRIVLGYIHNQSRRFFTYVCNRVQKIRHVSEPSQWNYVPSEQNPADIGSRGSNPVVLDQSSWFSGPDFLHKQSESVPEFFPMVAPETDKEIRCNVSVNAIDIQESDMLSSKRFEKFSTWSKLVLAISVLRHVAVSFSKGSSCSGWHSSCRSLKDPEFIKQTESFILRIVQKEFYSNEIQCLKGQYSLSRDSPILALDPFLDDNGLLRVGGRLSNIDLSDCQKHPVIVPGKHYIARLLVGHFHCLVQHQGRQLTEGAIRDAGFWVTGGKRLVTSLIFQCVTCKKLRGKFLGQKMSDLPVDRVQKAAPFTYVGVDVFGPWSVVSRRTRGGQASSKRWAVLFTCLTIRAVHIEVIDEMSSSSFINALRRFVSLRGVVKQFRSDRGTNFVGATALLDIEAINVEDRPIEEFMQSHGCQWVFNPPHSSHIGGSWERMIGIARRILESMLRTVTTLTHDVLVTLMAEVTAIINSRPIVPVSNDPDNPEVLSPSMLLTSKAVHDFTSVSDLDVKSLYGAQWKKVQYLAEQFWSKWRREYLNTLQNRRKWNYEQEPLCVDDIVLLKDREVNRNAWPMARVTRVFSSKDKKLRTVEIVVFKDGKQSTYVRPVHELVLLVKAEK